MALYTNHCRHIYLAPAHINYPTDIEPWHCIPITTDISTLPRCTLTTPQTLNHGIAYQSPLLLLHTAYTSIYSCYSHYTLYDNNTSFRSLSPSLVNSWNISLLCACLYSYVISGTTAKNPIHSIQPPCTIPFVTIR